MPKLWGGGVTCSTSNMPGVLAFPCLRRLRPGPSRPLLDVACAVSLHRPVCACLLGIVMEHVPAIRNTEQVGHGFQGARRFGFMQVGGFISTRLQIPSTALLLLLQRVDAPSIGASTDRPVWRFALYGAFESPTTYFTESCA